MVFFSVFVMLMAVIVAAGISQPNITTGLADFKDHTPAMAYVVITTPVTHIDLASSQQYSIIKSEMKFDELYAGCGFQFGNVNKLNAIFGFPVNATSETTPVHPMVNISAFPAPVIEYMYPPYGERIARYHQRNPLNRIPAFVLCTSLHGRPRMYTRHEIYMALATAQITQITMRHNGEGSVGSRWPRPFASRRPDMRPRNLGNSTGRLIEYPVGTRDQELNGTYPDRVVFDTNGLYVGMIRYHSSLDWHWCYPADRTVFRRRRTVISERVNATARQRNLDD
ncbi:hypothetical protein GGR54DRAFT_647324 [Hypoxylon sp. NC1633]|nr:hypothetical protein GGR54DRAFT_647324 [Hypoxylon sp. NC1633]